MVIISVLSAVNARLSVGRWPARRAGDHHTVTPSLVTNDATYDVGDCLYGALVRGLSAAYALSSSSVPSPELASLLEAYARCAFIFTAYRFNLSHPLVSRLKPTGTSVARSRARVMIVWWWGELHGVSRLSHDRRASFGDFSNGLRVRCPRAEKSRGRRLLLCAQCEVEGCPGAGSRVLVTH